MPIPAAAAAASGPADPVTVGEASLAPVDATTSRETATEPGEGAATVANSGTPGTQPGSRT